MGKIRNDNEPRQPELGRSKVSAGVRFKPRVLEAVDQLVRELPDRDRSWVINNLLETHPKIRRRLGAA